MKNNKMKNKYTNSKSFLQSSEWEEFQKSLGRDVFRIDGKLFIKMPLALGQSYLYCPRSICSGKFIYKFVEKAKKLARKENAFFIRFEPAFIEKNVDLEEFRARKVTSRQPDKTLLLDLSIKEKELLLGMKQKARYNIKLAQKKGVKIKKSVDAKDIDKFYAIALKTAKRDKIKIYDKEYYEKMARVFLKNKKFTIYFAKYNNKVIASNLMLYYDKIAYYLHGASGNEYRNVMAPYLLQWRVICDAKKMRFKYYDFWGTSPLKRETLNDKFQMTNKSQIQNSNSQNKIYNSKFIIQDTKHPWYGITKFKLGFAPTTRTAKYVEYPGCFEISYGKKRYFLYSMFKRVM